MELKNDTIPSEKPLKNQEKILMKWTIKAKPRDTTHMDIGMAIIIAIGIAAIINGIHESYILNLSEENGSVFLNLRAGIIWTLVATYLWILVIHQKKTYTYTITETVGTEESSVNFPKPFHIAFKAISALFFIIIIATIIYSPSSALILAGPAGMALIAAKFFLTWNNTPKIEKSSEWKEYKFVTIDKKRRLIVAQHTDIMIGFEARLPESLFAEYLSTLKELLPQDAVFTEKNWMW